MFEPHLGTIAAEAQADRSHSGFGPDCLQSLSSPRRPVPLENNNVTITLLAWDDSTFQDAGKLGVLIQGRPRDALRRFFPTAPNGLRAFRRSGAPPSRNPQIGSVSCRTQRLKQIHPRGRTTPVRPGCGSETKARSTKWVRCQTAGSDHRNIKFDRDN